MTRPPFRVLQVVHALGMGGAETWLMELLRFWSASEGRRVDFLLTGGAPSVFDDEARALGAELHYVPYTKRTLPRFIERYRMLLRSGRYDAVHDHADYVSGWHLVMGLGALPPVRIAHVHNPRLHLDANYAVNPVRRLTSLTGKALVARVATHVCGTSDEILRLYGFTPGSRARPAVSVVHCGIDAAKFNGPRDPDRRSVLREFGWPAGTRLALFAGRLDRALAFDEPANHKNSWFAVNVAREAIAKDSSLRLLVAGDGPSRPALQAHIDAWGLHDSVRLIGIRRDIPRLMRAANVLFFPSRQEGLGMVSVEAQAAGLPVLASTAVPSESVVLPELCHALPLSAPIETWAEALLDTAKLPDADSERCREAIEQSAFSIRHSATTLEGIYTGAA